MMKEEIWNKVFENTVTKLQFEFETVVLTDRKTRIAMKWKNKICLLSICVLKDLIAWTQSWVNKDKKLIYYDSSMMFSQET